MTWFFMELTIGILSYPRKQRDAYCVVAQVYQPQSLIRQHVKILYITICPLTCTHLITSAGTSSLHCAGATHTGCILSHLYHIMIKSNGRHIRSSIKISDQRVCDVLAALGSCGKHTAPPHQTQLHGRSAYTSAPQMQQMHTPLISW